MLAVSAAVSAVFGYLAAPPGTPRFMSTLLGVANALAVATPIVLFELYRMHWAFARHMRRWPLLGYLAFKNLYYLVCIVGGTLLVRLAFNGFMGRPFEFDRIMVNSFFFGAVMVFIGTFSFEMGRLLGWVTLTNLLTGRYIQPRREQKVFLLIDMKDSTGHAERLGPVRFHELLNAFFRDVADAALECDADIHKYVGDEAILTWPADATLADGDCLACPFIARDFIAGNGEQYRARFGVVPEFRATLHCGEIVAGEIGDLRREIAYVGDTLNVAARLLDTAKTLHRDVLVSADLLQSTTLPPDLVAEPLPTLSVRGRSAPLQIFALERSS
ncbi:MAG: adenylate/guanylate cyclase domain-containing protein [Reyranella sp.]|uniref:adenylate/guanylate cyclase domain-containing protein n=1 Tax=Reyranella sp. TaxID=1929291 RepID=UPI00273106D5|nr:adenylate/guanylate cyclase domain-containing protein [Reyranella sp.]MDP1963241.1 adenylate/guanylate cyclase domain-containing protein [Reyranella sp.]MDP2373806.1 adenylate/guanylate cyclase domain-containing protein [Reyranella sp.]